MGTILSKIPYYIGQLLVFIIPILGVWVFIKLVGIGNKIKKMTDVREMSKKHRTSTSYVPGGFVDVSSAENMDELRKNKEAFKQHMIDYRMYQQYIPIFPLLGILGTVSGLIGQLATGFKQEGLATSMNTTFWGLICAIVLKFVDAKFISRIVNAEELYYESNEEKYQISKDKRREEQEEYH